MKQHATIVGAGLVGSLLATILGKRGYRVTVFEKRPDLRKVPIPAGRSINLALAERGLHALKFAGLFDSVEPLLIPMRGRQLHLEDGHQEFVPYGQHPWELIYSISRPGLNQLLMSAAEETGQVSIHFQRTCEGVDFARRTLKIRDERSGDVADVSFEWVLGADGAASILRRAIIDQTEGEETMELLDHGYKELCIPAGPGDAFLIQREALHIWPRGGFMLIALPNLGGSFTVTLFLARGTQADPEAAFERLTDEQAVRRFFQSHFADAVALMPNLAEDFFANPMGELGTVRCWPWWVDDRALVLGDAAHAIVPFHGQGMNAGFEDCVELAQRLEGHRGDRSQLAEEFSNARKPNADAIAQMALENYIDMRDTTRQKDFLQRKELGFELERRFPDRFIPRYSMVMFHRLPYSEALARGEIQQAIIDQLMASSTTDVIDWQVAERLVVSRLAPLETAAAITSPRRPLG